ncbi:ABC-type transport auxiliary lipoprotein family protein [Sterolibacterium denitrificans]|nr:ABC-type transport auxiliary lipoprotein family protein [Sterolibacterium denitrificans]
MYMKSFRSAFWLALAAVLGLGGCFAGGVQKAEPARYDLFVTPPTQAAANRAAVGRDGLLLWLAEIETPTWLDTAVMQYRLEYVEPRQRRSFVESRWVAPPAALLEQMVRRNESFSGRQGMEDCQLHLALEEFIQEFAAPDSSRALIEVRVSVLGGKSRGMPLLAQRDFRQTQAAGGDAQSGVAAFAVSARDLVAELERWLAGLQQESPALMASCRAHVP